MTNDVALDVRGLQKTFGDVRAIDGLDLTVATAQVHGLVGPNGAGKTTLLRILFGLVAPDAGVVTLLGQVADDAETPSTQGIGGFVEEPRFYPYLTARRNLELMADLDGGGRERIDEVLENVRLADRADRKVGGFSWGCGSGWGSRRRSCGSHASCCSTSRPSGSIPPEHATCWRSSRPSRPTG